MPGKAWMQFWVGDWRRDPCVRMMSAEARGVWMELLFVMHETDAYQVEGSPKDIARSAGMDTDEFLRGVAEIEKHQVAVVEWDSPGYVTVLSRRRQSEAQNREYEAERKKKYRREKQKKDLSQQCPNDVPLYDSDSDSITTEVKEKKKKEKVSFSDSTIGDIYQLYPRKVGKTAALNAIRKALQRVSARGQPDPAVWMTQRVEAFAASPAGQAGKYCPHPSTWFNQDRFDDDENEWQRDNEPDQRTHTGSQRNVPIREQLQREYGEGRNGVGLADAGGHYAAVHRLPPAVGSGS